MGTLRRFPKSHIVAICLIATPLASLVVVNTSEERTQQTHNEMNLVSVPSIVGDALDRRGVLGADLRDRAIDDAFGHRLLAALHHHVDEAGNQQAAVLGIGQQFAGRGIAFT